MELNARSATIVLLAAFAGEVLCGIAIGIAAVVLTWPQGIHDSDQLQRMLDKLSPLTILTPLIMGMVTIGISKALVPGFLKTTTPTDAAWVRGSYPRIVKGLGMGLFVGGCLYALNMLLRAKVTYQHVTYEDLRSFDKLAYSPSWIWIWVLGGVFLAPVSEEILFRGVAYAGYRKSFGPVWAVVITTGVFLLGHVLDIFSFVPNAAGLTVLSLAALWCRLRWNAIGPAVAVHAGYNGVIACVYVYQLIR